MKVVDLSSTRLKFSEPVVGIGNFDGVHRGHQAVFDVLKEEAGEKGTPGLITFSHLTRKVIGGGPVVALTTPVQRRELFRRAGIKVCWVIDFNRKFSRLSPEEFIRKILVGRLGVKGVCVGEGYRFGRFRKGGVQLLRKMGAELGFRVYEVKKLRIGGRRVSSTLIRELIKEGDLERASAFLGRDYCLTGTIVSGDRLGGRRGYATANFYPEQMLPAAGVYAARVEIAEGEFGGMAYVGSRPTLEPGRGEKPRAEVHIFDWKRKLYRRRIKLWLKKRVRRDIKFSSIESLYRQIARDEKKIRVILARKPLTYSSAKK